MNRKFITYMCYFILSIFAISLTCLSPLLSEIASLFSVDMAHVGSIFSANTIGFLLFTLLGGILADKYGKKIVLVVTLFLFSTSLFLFPNMPNFIALLLISVLMGGTNGIAQSIISAMVGEINSDKPAFYINMAHGFFGLGALIGPLCVGYILTSHYNWNLLFYILSVVAIMFAVILMFTKLPELKKNENITISQFKQLITDKKILIICVCIACSNGSEIGSWGWMSTFLKQGLLFSAVKSSIAVSVFWLSMTSGRMVLGYLSQKFNLKSLIMCLGYGATLSTIFAGTARIEALLWLGIMLMGLTYSGLCPLLISYGSLQSDKNSGTLFALLLASGSIGIVAIPYIMGLIGQYININLAMVTPAVFLLIIGLTFTNIQKPETYKQM